MTIDTQELRWRANAGVKFSQDEAITLLDTIDAQARELEELESEVERMREYFTHSGDYSKTGDSE